MRRLCIPMGVMLALTAALEAQTAASPESIEFNFNYKPGKVSRLRMINRAVGSIKLPEPLPEQKFSQTFEQLMVSRAVKVNPDKSAVFEMTLAEIIMKINVGGLSLAYDSRHPRPQTSPASELDAMDRIFSAMIGMKLNTTMSATGQVVKVEGLSEAMKKVLASAIDENTPAMVKNMLDQLGDAFSDGTMTQQMQSGYRMLPGKPGPLRVGDKWSKDWSQSIPVVGTMRAEGKYELAGIEQYRGRRCAKIRISETMSTTPAPAGQPGGSKPSLLDMMSVQMTSNMGEGYAYFDYENAELVQLRQTMDMTLRLSPKAGGQEAPPMAVPNMIQRIKNSISIDLEEPTGQPASAKPAVGPGSGSE